LSPPPKLLHYYVLPVLLLLELLAIALTRAVLQEKIAWQKMFEAAMNHLIIPGAGNRRVDQLRTIVKRVQKKLKEGG
jgi:hypothetical protein